MEKLYSKGTMKAELMNADIDSFADFIWALGSVFDFGGDMCSHVSDCRSSHKTEAGSAAGMSEIEGEGDFADANVLSKFGVWAEHLNVIYSGDNQEDRAVRSYVEMLKKSTYKLEFVYDVMDENENTLKRKNVFITHEAGNPLTVMKYSEN